MKGFLKLFKFTGTATGTIILDFI